MNGYVHLGGVKWTHFPELWENGFCGLLDPWGRKKEAKTISFSLLKYLKEGELNDSILKGKVHFLQKEIKAKSSKFSKHLCKQI